MTNKYELITKEFAGEESKIVKRLNDDGSISWIPLEPANADYQAYLRWLNGEEEQSGTL